MGTLGGKHRQSATGREITYWVTYEELSSGEVALCAVFTEPGWRTLGQLDLKLEPSIAPSDLRVRSATMTYIERTAFGEGSLPPPNWIGWYGNLL